MAKETIIRCRFAGDPEDEYCCNCDGIHPVGDDGKAVDAPMCGGYEPEAQKQEQPAPVEPASDREIGAESCETVAPNTECIKGITTVIRAESGLTREINGTYFKFMFSEERILPEGCDIEAEKRALWDAVNAEVDAQLEAVRN